MNTALKNYFICWWNIYSQVKYSKKLQKKDFWSFWVFWTDIHILRSLKATNERDNVIKNHIRIGEAMFI